MKKAISLLLTVIMAATMMTALSGCKSKDPIVGTWVLTDMLTDGVLMSESDPEWLNDKMLSYELSPTFKFTEDGKLAFESSSRDEKTRDTGTYELSVTVDDSISNIYNINLAAQTEDNPFVGFFKKNDNKTFYFEVDTDDYWVFTEKGYDFEAYNKAKYDQAAELMNNGQYEEAIKVYKALGDYSDSKDKITECDEHIYDSAIAAMNNNDLAEAKKLFKLIPDYKDVKELDSKIVVQYSVESTQGGDWDGEKSEYEHDDNGNRIKETHTSSDGSISIWEYEYDDNGNELKETYTDSDGDVEITEYEYDDNGNIIKKTHKRLDGSVSIFEYEYDDNGNIIKETYTRSDKKVNTREYEYDENDNLLKKKYTKTDGKVDISEYLYDDNGDIIKETTTDSDGDISITEYDDNGNIIKRTSKYFNGSVSIFEYEYDDNGNIIKETHKRSDGSVSIHEYEYDDNGNIIKETYTLPDGSVFITEYEYEYDDNGNEVKRIYVDSKGETSTITYSGYLYFLKK